MQIVYNNKACFASNLHSGRADPHSSVRALPEHSLPAIHRRPSVQKEVLKAMAKSVEKYELMYVLNPNLSEEDTAAIVEKFKALIESNGTVDELQEMGKRKLAYEINYLTEGYYVLVKFTCDPDFPAELDRVLGITDGVIRSLITLRQE